MKASNSFPRSVARHCDVLWPLFYYVRRPSDYEAGTDGRHVALRDRSGHHLRPRLQLEGGIGILFGVT